MGVLELTKRRLHPGTSPTDPSLLAIFPTMRSASGADYVFFSSIEDPAVFFILGAWTSVAAHTTFLSSPSTSPILAPLNALSAAEWTEHMPLTTSSLSSQLPILAPCMTVTRAFLKGGAHPAEYQRKISELKAPIEAETAPHPVVFGWTTDTVEGQVHKWLMFVGWRSRQHHRDYAAMLRETLVYPEFPGIPGHYAEGTMHMHTWNMESPPGWVGE